jgi:hypothetical protein
MKSHRVTGGGGTERRLDLHSYLLHRDDSRSAGCRAHARPRSGSGDHRRINPSINKGNAMTFKELIDGLSKLNPDHEIAVAWDMGFEDSDEITPEKLLLGVPLGFRRRNGRPRRRCLFSSSPVRRWKRCMISPGILT